jgi:hypothetical protein
MRNLLTRIVAGLAVVGSLAALWIIPTHAQQVPGTLERPGMTAARVWINNKTRDEAIPVQFVSTDPGARPLPVTIQGVADVSVNGLVEARTTTLRQSWEYRSVSTAIDGDLGAVLGAAGREGWEAVGLTAQPGGKVVVLLKRPR